MLVDYDAYFFSTAIDENVNEPADHGLAAKRHEGLGIFHTLFHKTGAFAGGYYSEIHDGIKN